MCVLSLIKVPNLVAISIHDKTIKKTYIGGAFSAKFSMTPSGWTVDGTRKSLGLKWWHGPPGTSIIMQNLLEIERRTSVWEGKDWCFSLYFFLFVNNAQQINADADLVALLQQEIASLFVGRFRCGLHHFFDEGKPFLDEVKNLKSIARWRYDWRTNAREKFQNMRKCVRVARNILPQRFIPYTVECRCAPNKYVSLICYMVPRKTVKFVQIVPKSHSSATICAHRKAILGCAIFTCVSYAEARLSYGLDVCPSVRPSHAGTVSKRLNILSCFLRHTIAHSF